MHNIVGPTLVAMATKFGLGAEIGRSNRLPACLYIHVILQSIHNISVTRYLCRDTSMMTLQGIAHDVQLGGSVHGVVVRTSDL